MNLFVAALVVVILPEDRRTVARLRRTFVLAYVQARPARRDPDTAGRVAWPRLQERGAATACAAVER